MGPDNEFDPKERFCKALKSPIVLGSVSSRELDERFRCTRFSRRVKERGISPFRLFPDKSTKERLGCQCLGRKPERFACERVTECKNLMLLSIIEGPLAVTLAFETVNSVTFSSLLSQTPVSFFRLLMQVNDRRFKANSVGRRMTGMGQLRKPSEVTVESDLRAVEDKATASEQLKSDSERRWRKGEEKSQVAAKEM